MLTAFNVAQFLLEDGWFAEGPGVGNTRGLAPLVLLFLTFFPRLAEMRPPYDQIAGCLPRSAGDRRTKPHFPHDARPEAATAAVVLGSLGIFAS